MQVDLPTFLIRQVDLPTFLIRQVDLPSREEERGDDVRRVRVKATECACAAIVALISANCLVNLGELSCNLGELSC